MSFQRSRDYDSNNHSRTSYESSYGNNNGRSGGRYSSNGFSDARNGSSGPVEVDFSKLLPIKKVLYKEHPEVTKIPQAEVEKARTDNMMQVRASSPAVTIPKPITTFEHIKDSLGSVLFKQLEKLGFARPTFIQAQGWPMALSGSNVVGIAQTGSGKTLSFALPALVHLLANRDESERSTPVRVIVLAPTRELACQIQEVIRPLANAVNASSATIYGGVPKGPQIRTLRGGVEVIVATPGRLLDFMDAGLVTVGHVSFLVLDEADRMLDMGFEPQIRRVLKAVRPDRQVLFWSATWPKAVQRLAYDILGRDYLHVTIGSSQSSLTANKRIKQTVIITSQEEKEDKLAKLLENIVANGPAKAHEEMSHVSKSNGQPMCRTIIFTNKKRVADDLAWKAHEAGYSVDSLHGDKGQPERDAILAAFKKGNVPLLVATDVAARGLDVRGVRVVINYDMPVDLEDYVHRIGRTGRGGDAKTEEVEEGYAYALFDPASDKGIATDLLKLLEEAKQDVPDQLRALVKPRFNNNSGSRGGFNRFSRGGFNQNQSNRRDNYGGRSSSYQPYR